MKPDFQNCQVLTAPVKDMRSVLWTLTKLQKPDPSRRYWSFLLFCWNHMNISSVVFLDHWDALGMSKLEKNSCLQSSAVNSTYIHTAKNIKLALPTVLTTLQSVTFLLYDIYWFYMSISDSSWWNDVACRFYECAFGISHSWVTTSQINCTDESDVSAAVLHILYIMSRPIKLFDKHVKG